MEFIQSFGSPIVVAQIRKSSKLQHSKGHTTRTNKPDPLYFTRIIAVPAVRNSSSPKHSSPLFVNKIIFLNLASSHYFPPFFTEKKYNYSVAQRELFRQRKSFYFFWRVPSLNPVIDFRRCQIFALFCVCASILVRLSSAPLAFRSVFLKTQKKKIKTGSNFLRTGGHFERERSNNRRRRDRRDRPVKVSISQKKMIIRDG